MQTVAQLIRYFSSTSAVQLADTHLMTIDRIRKVMSYVEEHYKENISLQDVSDLLGIGKEYFCRFFKKNMGISFLQYLNEVRLSHIYQGLMDTDLPYARHPISLFCSLHRCPFPLLRGQHDIRYKQLRGYNKLLFEEMLLPLHFSTVLLPPG